MPIELPLNEPTPVGCMCTWQFHIESSTKVIKFFHANCPVSEHVKAFNIGLDEPPQIEVTVPKKERGRPKNLEGQWHKKKPA